MCQHCSLHLGAVGKQRKAVPCFIIHSQSAHGEERTLDMTAVGHQAGASESITHSFISTSSCKPLSKTTTVKDQRATDANLKCEWISEINVADETTISSWGGDI